MQFNGTPGEGRSLLAGVVEGLTAGELAAALYLAGTGPLAEGLTVEQVRELVGEGLARVGLAAVRKLDSRNRGLNGRFMKMLQGATPEQRAWLEREWETAESRLWPDKRRYEACVDYAYSVLRGRQLADEPALVAGAR